MDFTVIVEDKPRKNWNDLLAQSQAASSYQIIEWNSVYQSIYGSSPIYLSVFNGKGENVAQLSMLVHENYLWSDTNIISSYFGKNLGIGKTLSWNYGPIIHDIDNSSIITSKILETVENIVKTKKIITVSGMFPPLSMQPNTLELTRFGYKVIPWATSIIDLNQDVNDLYKSLDKKTRHDIRKSIDFNFTFEIVNDQSQLFQFKKMKTDVRKERGDSRNFSNPIFFKQHWDQLYTQNYEKMFLVKHENEYVSGMLCLFFNGYVIQYSVVISPRSPSLSGTFLTWHVLKWAINNGYRYFDMGGINPTPQNEKEKQIGFFKTKWGGKEYQYLRCVKSTNKCKSKIALLLRRPEIIKKKLNRLLK